MIKCRECGTLNSYDRILCVSCGKKLDFDDPGLMEATHPTLSETSTDSRSPASKIRLAQSNFTAKVIFCFFVFLVFLSLFLALQPPSLLIRDLKLSAAKSLDKKMSRIQSPEGGQYATFNMNEINIYLDRKLSPLREQVNALTPSFFQFQTLRARLGDFHLTLFLQYRIINRPVTFSLMGFLSIQDDRFLFQPHRLSIGKLVLPRMFLRLFFSGFRNLLEQENSLQISPNVSSLKIHDQTLTLYTGESPRTSSNGLPPGTDEKLPDDVLLIQAGDNFYSRKQYKLAGKYYALAIHKFPKSPLKAHALKQFKSCQENL